MLLVSKNAHLSNGALTRLTKKAQTAFQRMHMPMDSPEAVCLFTTVQAAVDAAASSYKKAQEVGAAGQVNASGLRRAYTMSRSRFRRPSSR